MKTSDLIFLPLRLFNQALGVLWGEGSWSLRTYELKLIHAAAAKLSPENRIVLDQQLKSSFYVERLHQNRMTRIHFRWRDDVMRMDIPQDYRLAKMRLKSGRRAVSISVEAYDGLIFTLQYYKPPKPVVLEDFTIAKIEYGGKGDDSIAEAIDREEHGDEHISYIKRHRPTAFTSP